MDAKFKSHMSEMYFVAVSVMKFLDKLSKINKLGCIALWEWSDDFDSPHSPPKTQ